MSKGKASAAAIVVSKNGKLKMTREDDAKITVAAANGHEAHALIVERSVDWTDKGRVTTHVGHIDEDPQGKQAKSNDSQGNEEPGKATAYTVREGGNLKMKLQDEAKVTVVQSSKCQAEAVEIEGGEADIRMKGKATMEVLGARGQISEQQNRYPGDGGESKVEIDETVTSSTGRQRVA